MTAVFKFFISFITIISIVVYSIGQGQREGILEYFKLSFSAYQIDLLSGLWQGGLLLFTWSILPSFMGLTSAIALALTPEISKEVFAQKIYFKLASVINHPFEKTYKLLQKNCRWKLLVNLILIIAILAIFLFMVFCATKAGEEEAIRIVHKLNSNENLVQIVIDGEQSPINGVEIVSGPSFTSFYTSSGVVTTSNDSIKKITHISINDNLISSLKCNIHSVRSW